MKKLDVDEALRELREELELVKQAEVALERLLASRRPEPQAKGKWSPDALVRVRELRARRKRERG